jgi:hypothetical protein
MTQDDFKRPVDWELIARRTAWENCNNACSAILSARISAGLVKHKDTKEAVDDLLRAISIEFEAFLCIKNDTSHKTDVGGPPAGDEPSITSSSPNKSEPFLKDVGSSVSVGASPPSPQKSKEKKLKGEKKTGWVCSECNAAIEVWVKDYSETNMGKSLCYACQDKYRERRESIENASGPRDIGKY